MCFFTMYDHDGVADLTGTAQNREVDEGKSGCGVPAVGRVAAAGMVATRSFIIVIILLDKLRSVGRQRVNDTSGTAVISGAVIFGTLRRHLLKHLVAVVGIVVGIEIAVGGATVDVIHR